MTDFKVGDKVVVLNGGGKKYWTPGKVYTVVERGDGLFVRDDDDRAWVLGVTYQFAPAPDADGWYPMPKLKAGDPIPEWLVDERTEYRGDLGSEYGPTNIRLSAIYEGLITHYRPAPQTETATTADGKEYRITHNPDGSVTAEVV